LWTQPLPDGLPLTPAPYDSETFTGIMPAAAQQNAFYSIGSGYALRLILTGTGADGEAHRSVDKALPVVYETLDKRWWQWTVDTYREFQWKVDDYSLSGRFHNRSAYSAFTISTAVLLEQNEHDQDPPDARYASDQGVQTVSKGSDVEITYSAKHFVKTWQWYLDGIFQPDSDKLEKLFAYTMILDLKDQFGNAYPPPTFDTAVVSVSVSQQKQNAAIAAETSFSIWAAESALAAAVSWIPFASILPAAIATAAAGALAVAGKIASDPPSPDPHFAHHVRIVTPAVPSLLRDERHLIHVVQGFELAFGVLARVSALSTIEGRIMGAQRAKDRAAETMQRDDYRDTVRQVVDEADRLVRLAPQVMTALDPQNLLGRDRLRDIAAVKESASVEAIPSDVQAAIGMARTLGLTLPPSEAPRAFDRLAAALRNLAHSVARDSRRIVDVKG
jgi:hypothetical protein